MLNKPEDNRELNFGYLGYSQVTKQILDHVDVEPSLVISFDNSIEEKYGRSVEYSEYDTWLQIETINSERAKSALRNHDIDVLLVMGWPELLAEDTLEIPNVGSVGRHLSLLPERRGRAPVAWALIHGLKQTGVSLFWLDTGIDSGPLVNQWPVEITTDDHAQDLHEKCTETTIQMLNEETIPDFRDGVFPATTQNEENATYTHPRRPDMGVIDWTDSAMACHNFIRGQSHPYPGAFSYHKMDKVRFWRSRIEHPMKTIGTPGEILEKYDTSDESEYDKLRVQCSEGVLIVKAENNDGDFPVTESSRFGAIPY